MIGFGLGYSDVSNTEGYSDQFDLYNTTSKRWFASGVVPSKEARQYATAVGCGGKILFAGGQVAGGRSAAVDIYDVSRKTWTNMMLSVARSNLAAACILDRYVVFAGGQIPGRATVDVLDLEKNVWMNSEIALNTGRGWLSAGSVDNCAVFAGGQTVPGKSDIDVFCLA